jgi:hypothetical protein
MQPELADHDPFAGVSQGHFGDVKTLVRAASWLNTSVTTCFLGCR